MMAGFFLTLALDTPNAVGGIGDAVDPTLLARSCHDALSAVINQHCFNLLSIGTFALAGAFLSGACPFRPSCMTAIVSGLAGVRYFLFQTLAVL